jgi:hypothetical protein
MRMLASRTSALRSRWVRPSAAPGADFILRFGARSRQWLLSPAADDILRPSTWGGRGVAVLSPEGTAAEALQAADLVAPDIAHALELLERPMRLVAGLRR